MTLESRVNLKAAAKSPGLSPTASKALVRLPRRQRQWPTGHRGLVARKVGGSDAHSRAAVCGRERLAIEAFGYEAKNKKLPAVGRSGYGSAGMEGT